MTQICYFTAFVFKFFSTVVSVQTERAQGELDWGRSWIHRLSVQLFSPLVFNL